MDPIVFLDRDNTLIANDGDLGDPAQVRLLPDVAIGLRRLKDSGFRLVVVTNQGGVARGSYSESDVDLVHARIAQLVDEESGGQRVLDRFYYCPFHPEAVIPEYRREHPWRKPQPGMLLQAAQDLQLDLDHGWMIGDQMRDVTAGRAAGVRTILLSSREGHDHGPDFTVSTFDAAVETVLEHRASDPAEAARRAVSRAKSQLEAKPRAGDHSASVATMVPASGKKRRLKSHQKSRGARSALEPLRRALVELVEEVRSDRTRRGEFGTLRIAAAGFQLTTFVCAVFAMIELGDLMQFGRWMGWALLAQLTTIALLQFDRH